jgi:predicted nucleic acid-binding protein
MRFFIDANVILYALVDAEPAYARSCVRLLDAVVDGRADGVSSTAVLEEVLHVELSSLSSKHPELRGVAGLAYSMLTPLLPVTDEAFRLALELEAGALGANDRVHAGTCRAHGIETIVSGDRGFDGVPGLRRVDPLDADAVAALAD